MEPLLPQLFLLLAISKLLNRLPSFTPDSLKGFLSILRHLDNTTIDKDLVPFLQEKKNALKPMLGEYLRLPNQTWEEFFNSKEIKKVDDSDQQACSLVIEKVLAKVYRQVSNSAKVHKQVSNSEAYQEKNLEARNEEIAYQGKNLEARNEEIFYATDRNSKDCAYYDSRQSDGSLNYGCAIVSVPRGVHPAVPFEKIQIQNAILDPDPHYNFVIKGIYGCNSLISLVNQSILKKREKPAELLVYVHGFNVSFDDAIKTASKLKIDLKFSGVVTCYSWASKGNLYSYLKDYSSITETVTSLADLFKKCFNDFEASKWHIIAHGMGNKAVVDALVSVYSLPHAEFKADLDRVVLLAPDVTPSSIGKMVEAVRNVGLKKPRFLVSYPIDDYWCPDLLVSRFYPTDDVEVVRRFKLQGVDFFDGNISQLLGDDIPVREWICIENKEVAQAYGLIKIGGCWSGPANLTYTNMETTIEKAFHWAWSRSDSVDEYKCSFDNNQEFVRGTALVISMTGGREGANDEKTLITHLAHFFQFDIVHFTDSAASDLQMNISILAGNLEENKDCFVCFVNAHGGTDPNGNGYIEDNEKVRLLTFEDIMKPFLESACLLHKPKVFFINACRGGNKRTNSLAQAQGSREEKGETRMHRTIDLLANRADVLAVFSSDVGDVSWRDPDGGAIFIRLLTQMVTQCNNDDDLLSIITKVNHVLSNVNDVEEDKPQTLVIESTLTKKLYWHTKIKDHRTSLPMFIRRSTPKKQCVVENIFGQENHFKELKEGLLTSRQQTFGITIFGLYGMGGIGKTTLAKSIFNDPDIQEHFKGHVYWLIVNRDPDILEKQRALIFEMCHSTPPEFKDEQVLRGCLQDHMRSLPRFLLVLDDVWLKSDIDRILGDLLTKVIPSESACLITTRIPEELQGFGAQKIEIHLLSDDDSRALFCIHAFKETKIPEELSELVEGTIRACGNLPILLEVIGSERSGKRDKTDWAVTCKRLKAAQTLHNNQYDRVVSSLKISYDSLPDDLKGKFLDFAAFPEKEDVEISQVLDLWTTPSLDEDTAYWEFLKLQDRCLIKISGYWCYVHAFIRRLAINIIEENTLPFRKQLFAGHDLKKFPPEWCKIQRANEAYKAEKLVLIKSQISSILKNATPFFRCLSHLKVLVLSSNLQLEEVHPEVFAYLEELEKLDLSWCFALKCLPAEIGKLKMLQKLNLAGCVALTALPTEIGELEELIELNLHSTGIQMLPSTIGDCTNLRDLTLNDCRSLKNLPAEIGRLQCLEFLDASLVHIQEIPKEVGNLKELRYLNLAGSDITSLPSELGNLRNLETFLLINCGQLSEVPSSLEKLCDGNLKEISVYNTGMSPDKLPGRLKEKFGAFDRAQSFDSAQTREITLVRSKVWPELEKLPWFDPGDKGGRRMAHGLARMLEVAKTEPFESERMKMAVRMIYTKANDCQTRHTVIANGGLPVLLRCFSESSHDDLAYNAGAALVNMCVSSSTHRLIKDAGGLNVLAEVLITSSIRGHYTRGRYAYQAFSWITSTDNKREEQYRIITNDFISKFVEHRKEGGQCICFECSYFKYSLRQMPMAR